MWHHILQAEKNCGKDLNIIKYFHIVGVYYNVYRADCKTQVLHEFRI